MLYLLQHCNYYSNITQCIRSGRGLITYYKANIITTMKKHVEHFLTGKKHEDWAKNKMKDPFNYKEKLCFISKYCLVVFWCNVSIQEN